VRLGIPDNSVSTLQDTSWPATTRVAVLKESSVAPGEVGTFEFWITTPLKQGTYRQDVNVIREGVAWMNNSQGVHIQVTVPDAIYSWQWQNQAIYTDSSKSMSAPNPYTQVLVPDKRYYIVVLAKNTGNIAWYSSDIKMGTSNPKDGLSSIYDSTWPASTRLSYLKESVVNPGEVGTFEFWITTPSKQGTYVQYLDLLREGVAWMNNSQGVHIQVTVPDAIYSWQWQNQSLYSDSSKTVVINPYSTDLNPSQRYFATLQVLNSGNTTWYKGRVNLGTWNPMDRPGLLRDPTWPNPSRLSTLEETSVAPGQIGTFEFWITSPASRGSYREYVNVVRESISWMNNSQGVHIYASVP
jgi:hypothetical protein